MIRGGAVAAALLAAASPAVAQGTLTGVTIYSTSSTGAFDFSNYWNTSNGDFVYNLYLSTTADGSAILNPSTTLSAPLAVGTNTFYVFGDAGSNPQFFGFNLFLGGGTAPILSGFAAANGGTVLSNEGQTSFQGTRVGVAAPLTIPAAGTTYMADGYLYTLTGFSFNTTQQFGDIASPFVLSANGTPDYFGQITISVAPVSVAVTPEPSTMVLTASGLLTIVGVTFRRRRVAAV